MNTIIHDTIYDEKRYFTAHIWLKYGHILSQNTGLVYGTLELCIPRRSNPIVFNRIRVGFYRNFTESDEIRVGSGRISSRAVEFR
jgi:hypothetical protein